MKRVALLAVLLAVLFGASAPARTEVRQFVQGGHVTGLKWVDGTSGPSAPCFNLDYGAVFPLTGAWLWGAKVGVAVPYTSSHFSPRIFLAVARPLGEKFLLVLPVGLQYAPPYFKVPSSLMYGGGVQISYRVMTGITLDLAIIAGQVLVEGAPDVGFALAFKPSITFTL